MKIWKVTAELDMDASTYKSVIVKANTERTALKMAEKKFMDDGAFHVSRMKAVRIDGVE